MKTKKIQNESKSLAKDISSQIQASPFSDTAGDTYSNENFSFQKPAGYELKEYHSGYIEFFKVESDSGINSRIHIEINSAVNALNNTSDTLLEDEIRYLKEHGVDVATEKIIIAGNAGYIIPYKKSYYKALFATAQNTYSFKLASTNDKSVEDELPKFLAILKTFKINSGS